MSVTVKFFAGLREALGISETTVEVDTSSTARDIWAGATNGAELPDNTLCAINLTHIELDQPVQDGDEVAFFPPVTGG